MYRTLLQGIVKGMRKLVGQVRSILVSAGLVREMLEWMRLLGPLVVGPGGMAAGAHSALQRVEYSAWLEVVLVSIGAGLGSILAAVFTWPRLNKKLHRIDEDAKARTELERFERTIEDGDIKIEVNGLKQSLGDVLGRFADRLESLEKAQRDARLGESLDRIANALEAKQSPSSDKREGME